MKYYVTTDLHLGHKAMKRFCNRPDGFEEKIFKNIENTVGEKDMLIVLGDVCLRNEEFWHGVVFDIIKCGKKILVKGNHDVKSYSWYYDHGWDFVCESYCVDFYGHRIVFSHKPIKIGDHTLNIHGHFHNNTFRKCEIELQKVYTDKHYLVSIENTNYMPLNLLNIVTDFNNKNKEQGRGQS